MGIYARNAPFELYNKPLVEGGESEPLFKLPCSLPPLQAFSGTVVEKDPMPLTVPHLTIAPPALPTILERKQEEVASDAPPPQQASKRVSKFKAARLQHK